MGLVCSNLKKSFGVVKALDVDKLSVEWGEIRAIFGGNGSGKSTLAKVLAGVLSPDSGEIFLDGQKVKLNSPISAKRLRIVATAQELSLFSYLSVIENLTLRNVPVHLGFLRDSKKSMAKVEAVLKDLGLEGYGSKIVGDLPDDQKYLVEFAKALLEEPRILIIDEITSALYREEVACVHRAVQRLAEKGSIVLFVSHRQGEIRSFCSSVTALRGGQAIGTYNLQDIDEGSLLREIICIPDKAQETENIIGQTQAATENQAFEPYEIPNINIDGVKIPSFKNEVSFNVQKGQMIGIAGLQGQGQSELLRLLFGVRGNVSVTMDNCLLEITSPRDAIQRGFAFLSGQREDNIFLGKSISKNLDVVHTRLFPNRSLDKLKLLRDYGVKFSLIGDPIESLSGGNQQKVIIGRWTSINPRLLLADDPTKGVDIASRRDIHLIFKSLLDQGSSIIMVSSDDQELVDISCLIDNYKIMVMYNGQIVKTLEGADISISNIITNSMPRGDCHA